MLAPLRPAIAYCRHALREFARYNPGSTTLASTLFSVLAFVAPRPFQARTD